MWKYSTMKLYKTPLIITKLILITLVTLTDSVCIHDQIQSKNVPRKHLLYKDTGHEHIIQKRDNEGPLRRGRGPPPPHPRQRPGFSKIRIYCDYHDLDEQLNLAQQDRVKSVIEDVISKVKDIFSGNVIQFPHTF